MIPTMPGRLVDVGGYRMHIDIRGSGTPAVVMDSGLAAPGALYGAVTPGVAEFTRVVVVDRPGYAWSDPAPASQPRVSARLVEEWRRALAAAGVPPPYVLVGASFGGINVLVHALTHPDEVAGLVLVDPSHPEMLDRAPGVPGTRTMRRGFRVMLALGRVGLLRLVGPIIARQVVGRPHNLPEPAWATLRYFTSRPALYEAALREVEVGDESFASARAPAGALGDLPLVIQSGDWWVTGRKSALKRAMIPLRDELAALSSRGEHEIVPDSGHAIPSEQPEAVVAAIRRVVEVVRAGATA